MKKSKENGIYYNFKIGVKITLLLVVTVSILFTVVNVVFSYILADSLESEVESKYTSEAEKNAILVTAKLNENISPLQSLADYIPELYYSEDLTEEVAVEDIIEEEKVEEVVYETVTEEFSDTTVEDTTISENTVNETVTENAEKSTDTTEENTAESTDVIEDNTGEETITEDAEEFIDVIEEDTRPVQVSSITGESFAKIQIQLEDYILNSIAGYATSLDDVKTIDAYLEPGLMSEDGVGYGIIVDNTGNYTGETDYAAYSSETFYSEVKNSGEIYISNAIKDEYGDYVITLAVPVLNSGEFMGALKLDLNISAFAVTKLSNTSDSSAYSNLYSQDMTMLYDSDNFSSSFESSIYDYVKTEEDDQAISGKIAVGQSFHILSKDMDGEKEYRFFSPINIDNETLWSSVAVYKSDIDSALFSAILKTSMVSVVAVLICCLMGTLIMKYTKMLNTLQENANKIIAGNFDVHGEVKSGDEIGKLTGSFNNMSDTLNDIISEINENLKVLASGDMSQNVKNPEKYVGKFKTIYENLTKISNDMNATISGIKQVAEQVKSGSEQVSNASQTLAHGTTEQAASIEELSASINYVAEQTKSSFEYSRIGKSSADESKLAIEDINKKLLDLTKAMNKINQKSDEINSIINTIDSIAFQTNILALNAAVEASRAGDAGKGFAVVADEVRNLAAKSKDAATNTSVLIEEVNLAIQEGIGHVDDTNESMKKVVKVSDVLIENVDKISKVSESQLETINGILLSSEEISSVVQSNSATSEETAAASDELENEASNLLKAIEGFKTK